MRDETQLQDLLAEPAVELIVALLQLATRDRAPEAWVDLVANLSLLVGGSYGEQVDEADREATQLVGAACELIDQASAEELPRELLAIVGSDRIRGAFRQYSRGLVSG